MGEEAAPSGSTKQNARSIGITKAVEELFQARVDEGQASSPAGMLLYFAKDLREGERWQDLIDVFRSKEVLLIGTQTVGETEGFRDLGDGMTLAEALGQCPIAINLDYLIREGSDSSFDSLKWYLLTPGLQFKEACHRLNGLYDMVVRVKKGEKYRFIDLNDVFEYVNSMGRSEAQDSAQQQQLMEFLASEITKRVKEVLGKPEERRDNEDSEIDCSDLESGGEKDDHSVARSDGGHLESDNAVFVRELQSFEKELYDQIGNLALS